MAAGHATVTALRSHTDGRQREPVLVLDAVEAFLSTPRCSESPNTRRAYDNVLRRVAELIGAYRALVDVDDDEIGAAITKLWGHAKPATWNRSRAAVGSWLAWCATGPGSCLKDAHMRRGVSARPYTQVCSKICPAVRSAGCPACHHESSADPGSWSQCAATTTGSCGNIDSADNGRSRRRTSLRPYAGSHARIPFPFASVA